MISSNNNNISTIILSELWSSDIFIYGCLWKGRDKAFSFNFNSSKRQNVISESHWPPLPESNGLLNRPIEYRQRAPGPEPLYEVTVNISCKKRSQITTKRHKTTTKWCKMTTKRHKMTTTRCKTKTKTRKTTTERQKRYKDVQNDHKETQNYVVTHSINEFNIWSETCGSNGTQLPLNKMDNVSFPTKPSKRSLKHFTVQTTAGNYSKLYPELWVCEQNAPYECLKSSCKCLRTANMKGISISFK